MVQELGNEHAQLALNKSSKFRCVQLIPTSSPPQPPLPCSRTALFVGKPDVALVRSGSSGRRASAPALAPPYTSCTVNASEDPAPCSNSIHPPRLSPAAHHHLVAYWCGCFRRQHLGSRGRRALKVGCREADHTYSRWV
jgi:hypothetical protein